MNRLQCIRTVVLGGILSASLAWLGIRHFRLDDRARFESIWSALERRNVEEARADWKAWGRSGSTDPRVLLIEGTLALREGKPDAAVEMFAHLDPASPDRERILLVTGEALGKLGRLAEAKSCLLSLVRDFPRNVEGHRLLTALLYDLGDNDAALREIDVLKGLVPADYRPYHLAGRIYADFERYDEAISNGREALKRSPLPGAEREIRECLAGSLIATQQPDEALAVLAGSEPTSGALILQAQALIALGRIPEARGKLSSALERDAQSIPVRSLSARLALEEGRTEEGMKLLQALLEQHPHEYKDRYRLALAYRQAGRTAESQAQLELFESSRALYRSLADLNAQAIEEPANAEVRLKLAALCRTLGKRELADVWDHAAKQVHLGKQPSRP